MRARCITLSPNACLPYPTIHWSMLVGVGGGFLIDCPHTGVTGQCAHSGGDRHFFWVIALNSVAEFLGYLGQVPLDWQLMAAFTLMAGCGTIIGAFLSRYVDSKQLQKGFAYFLLIVAAFILFQNRRAFYSSQSSRLHPNFVQQVSNR